MRAQEERGRDLRDRHRLPVEQVHFRRLLRLCRPDALRALRAVKLDSHSQVLVLTGAGVSAESGVPTCRGMNGSWEGHRVEEVASPEGFAADPMLVWRFYSLRREGAAKVAPNAGHVALTELEARLGGTVSARDSECRRPACAAGSRRMLAIHGELFSEQVRAVHRALCGCADVLFGAAASV